MCDDLASVGRIRLLVGNGPGAPDSAYQASNDSDSTDEHPSEQPMDIETHLTAKLDSDTGGTLREICALAVAGSTSDSTQRLLTWLARDDEDVRRAALRTLPLTQPFSVEQGREFVEVLLQHRLDTVDRRNGEIAIALVAEIGRPIVPALINLLSADDLLIGNMLHRIGWVPQEMAQVVMDAWADGEGGHVAANDYRLTDFDLFESPLDVARVAMHHSSAAVRQIGIAGLERLNAEREFETELRQLAGDPDEHVRSSAWRGLARLCQAISPSDPTRAKLLALVRDPSPTVRWQAYRNAWMVSDLRQEILAALSADADENLADHAGRELERLRAAETAPVDYLLDAIVNFEVDGFCFMRRLSELGRKALCALPRLEDLVASAPDFRWLWGSAIAMLEPSHRVARSLLNDPSHRVREKVIEGMTRAQSPPADLDSILQRFWHDDDHWVRGRAARLSRQRGQSGTEIAMALLSNMQAWPVYADHEERYEEWSSYRLSELHGCWGRDLRELIEVVTADAEAAKAVRARLETYSETELNINLYRVMWKVGHRLDAVASAVNTMIRDTYGFGTEQSAACELTYLMGGDASECVAALVQAFDADELVSREHLALALGRSGDRSRPVLLALSKVALEESPQYEDGTTPHAAADALGELLPEFAQLAPAIKRVGDHPYLRHWLRELLEEDGADVWIEQLLAFFVERYGRSDPAGT